MTLGYWLVLFIDSDGEVPGLTLIESKRPALAGKDPESAGKDNTTGMCIIEL